MDKAVVMDLSKCGGTCKGDCQHYRIGVACADDETYTARDSQFIDVVCLVLPTGETLWFEQSKGQDYMQKVLRKWKEEHPEITPPCTCAASHITMPRDKYIAIGAVCGPGCFEYPED